MSPAEEQPHHDDDPLNRFRVALDRYDQRDLARGIGALQLLPENAGRTIRLESVAEGIASLSPLTGAKVASRHDWMSWLNRGGLVMAGIVMLEDPFDNMFTEAIAFHAGSYTVFPGITEEGVLVTRQLCKAIFLRPDDTIRTRFQDTGFYSDAAQLIFSSLSISNMMAQRAGYEHGIESDTKCGGSVSVPQTERFTQLKHAVTFTTSEISALLHGRKPENSPLSRLLRTPGEYVTDPAGNPDSYMVDQRPILRIGADYIVVAPGAILSALRHAVVCFAQEHGVIKELAAAYHEAGQDTLDILLAYARMDKIPLRLAQEDPAGITRALYRFDADKIVHAVLLSDMLVDYDARELFGAWPCKDLFEHLVKSLQPTEQILYGTHPAPNEILHLIVFDSIGRSFVAGLSGNQVPASPMLMPRLGDLETMVYVEPDPLALWKFASAHREIRNKMALIQTSLLDEFQAYRKADHSYYLGDDARPNVTWIAGGGAGILRAEAMKRRGFFAAKSAHRTGITEVTLAHDDHRIPIFMPWPRKTSSIELLARLSGFNIWVTSPPLDDVPNDLVSYYAQFVDFVAYWLWQASRSLESVLNAIQPLIDQVRIEIHLIPGTGWRQIQSTQHVVRTCEHRGNGVLAMTLGSGIVAELNTADNTAERELLRVLLRGLRDLATSLVPTSGTLLTEDQIALTIDNVAPLGTKKKLLIMDASAAPLIAGAEEAPYRVVAEHDESQILDEMGDFARIDLQIAVGPLSNEQAHALANAVVDYLYETLRATISSLNPQGLLEQLVALNETLVQRQSDLNFTIPTRIACFAEFHDVVTKIGEELIEATKALTASRFLLEYVATQPPRGLRPFSMSVYDRILALTSMLIQWGFNSDTIHLNLAPSAITMLPSGRLCIQRESFNKVARAFQEERLLADIESSQRRFPRTWSNDSSQAETAFMSRLDKAAAAEFGISLTKLEHFLGAIMNISIELDRRVLSMTRQELFSRIRDQLRWNDEELTLAFEFFVTRPRPDFRKPPRPYGEKDIRPWRFGRPLSYLRRPILLQTGEGGETILCGFRNLYLAGGNLIGLILSERMKGQTPEFRSLIGEIRNEFSEEFNNDVASMIEDVGRGPVRVRVKKVGEKRLERVRGEDIGDVDVLWLIPEERRVLVIETKALVTARTPAEMANELHYLFEAKKGKRSGAKKHLERAKWIDEHLPDVLTWLGLDSSMTGWHKSEPLIVVDRELIADKIAPKIVTVMSLREFNAHYLAIPGS